MWREVFVYACEPEVFFDGENLRMVVERSLNAEPSDANLEVSFTRLGEVMAGERREWDELWGRLDGSDLRFSFAQAVLKQTAPMGLSLGAALQGLAAPCTYESQATMLSLSLLADDIGAGQINASRADAFRYILNRYQLSTLTLAPAALGCQLDIKSEMFCLPGVMRALARRSDAFGFELVGMDAALRRCGLLPCWDTLAKDTPGYPEWSRLDMSTRQTATPGAPSWEVSEELVALLASSEDAERRLAFGVGWFAEVLGAWLGRVRQVCERSVLPEAAMADLVRARAEDACVYHQRSKIEGRPMQEWFKDAAGSAEPFVRALGESGWVRKRDGKAAPLLRAIEDPDGAMFRVFTSEEIAIVRRWVDGLDTGTAPSTPAPPEHEDLQACSGDMRIGEYPDNIRDAYFLLHQGPLAPRMHRFAIDYATAWLERAEQSWQSHRNRLPEAWSYGAMPRWLRQAHHAQVAAFEETQDSELPSRAALIESSLQLAPLTLIDGSWLAGFCDLQLGSSAVGFRLFQIFWDELGNGDLRLNHPCMYRDTLRSMGHELPPTGSREFARDVRLHASSFRLAVFWLCMGKLPIRFGEEILGMNLAMELSGVGGAYRRGHQALHKYGFSTRFVDIHNTIDNVATGHARWAVDAIDARMGAVPAAEAERAWKRICVGYEALAPDLPNSRALDFFPQR